MEIKNIRFARVYKKDGATLLLRIDYPHVDVEGLGAERINSLYRKIAEAICSYAERLVSTIKSSTYALYHAYEASADAADDTLSVHRRLELKCGTRTIFLNEAHECLSLSEGIEKRHKNVKKQRIFPSRKKKNSI